MITKLQNPSGPQPNGSGEPRPSVTSLLAALTDNQRKRLEFFAAKRLRRLIAYPQNVRILSLVTAGDLVNESIHKVLLGETNPKMGRHMKLKNLLSTESFIQGLMNLVNSELANLITSAEAATEYIPLEVDDSVHFKIEIEDPFDLRALVNRRELKEIFFKRLRLRSNKDPEILAVVDLWERDFLTSDSIAEGADRVLVYHVRKMARQILREFSSEGTFGPDQGRNILL